MMNESAPSRPVAPQLGRRSRRRRWIIDALIVVTIYLGISAFQERNLLARGSSAPRFTLKTVRGEPLTPSQLRGKRVLLHFWATWCGVCRREHAALNAVHEGLGDDEVLISVVADADDVSAVESVIAQEGIRYPVVLGTDQVISNYRVSAFPTNYYLDADGRVRGHTIGMSNRWVMAGRLAVARW